MTKDFPKVVQVSRVLTYPNFAALVDRVAVLEASDAFDQDWDVEIKNLVLEQGKELDALKQVTTQLQKELKAIRSSYQSWRSTH